MIDKHYLHCYSGCLSMPSGSVFRRQSITLPVSQAMLIAHVIRSFDTNLASRHVILSQYHLSVEMCLHFDY